MQPGITEVASYLATQIPTGAKTPHAAVQDWRTTLYNARATGALSVVTDMVNCLAPYDAQARVLCEGLRKG